ncbi:putative bifunctional diguanylate cyclase/phosphodiesterase [Arsukibacterium sp.]|uniref:putative bifunctional diguanylate cyclase/phosphodiesterase n=1 Tax=Arsukibacterium sp. TaxID=1977258 RepID=UPI002FDAEFA1
MPTEIFARLTLYLTQLGMALMLSGLFWYFYSIYQQHYLKKWFWAFSSFAGYQLIVLLFNATPLGQSVLAFPLNVLSLFSSYVFAAMLLLGMIYSGNTVINTPAKNKLIWLILCGLMLLSLASELPLWLISDELSVRRLLTIHLRFSLMGSVILLSGLWLWQRPRQGKFVGEPLAALAMMCWGLLYLVAAISDVVHPWVFSTSSVIFVYKSVELLLLVLLSLALFIWLQENERNLSMQLAEKTRYLDQHDQLTGALNRDALLLQLQQRLSQQQVPAQVMLMLGLDKFKTVNESVGLKQGDRILREVIRRFEQSVLKPELIARTGGDIFALVLSDVAHEKQFQYALQHVQQLIEKPFLLDSGPLKLTTSIGVALYPEHATNAEQLLQKANIAFHQAKRLQTSWLSYQPGMEEETARLIGWESELLDAMANDQFVLYFQPQLSLRQDKLEGCEVLVRWQHPQRGLLMPGQFLPFVEQLDLSQQLDFLILRKAVLTLSRWKQAGLAIPLAVNMSPIHFQQDGLKRELQQLLTQNQLPPGLLELEITENTAMLDMEKGSNYVLELQQMGIRVSIDDFGTGYSSLAYLRRMPIDKIKIDRSFVADMAKNDSDMMIVKTMIRLAQGLGKRILAEGVESSEQLAILRALSCDAVQGYLIAKPLPEAEALLFYQQFSYSQLSLKKST